MGSRPGQPCDPGCAAGAGPPIALPPPVMTTQMDEQVIVFLSVFLGALLGAFLGLFILQCVWLEVHVGDVGL